MTRIAIAIISRDKFSLAEHSLRSVCQTLAQFDGGSKAIVYDSGYPNQLLQSLRALAAEYPGVSVEFTPTQQFANTNLVWNQFRREHGSADHLMCVENDVAVEPGAVDALVEAIETDFCDVAVARVHENAIGELHFDPVESRLDRNEDGSVRSTLIRRPKFGLVPPRRRREVAHLERHGFVVSRDAADQLGDLDEQMYCRTDLDLSLACRAAGLRVAVIPEANVLFRREPNLDIDHDFFDYRWNLERVAFANARLIEKWNLLGYKKTINHAHRIRAKYLDVPASADQTVHDR